MAKTIKVAIIDDEQDILDMIEKYLRRLGGFEVEVFSNPTHALTRVDGKYDIVFLDIMMPQMGCIQILDQ